MIKKLFCVLFSLIMVLSATGCNNTVTSMERMEIEEPDVYYFERFGDEEMPIGGYIGPTPGFGYQGNYMPSQITDKHYRWVRECGLDFIIGMKPDYKSQSKDVLDSLYYADKNDVMYFVADSGLFEVKESNAKDPNKYLYVSLDEFKARVQNYCNYDSFAGIVGRDEPWANMFDQIEKILYYFDQTFDDNKLLYLNSNSYQCPTGWFGGGSNGTEEEAKMTIEEYMTEWFESFPTLGYYSYDTYPYITPEPYYIRPVMFQNYSLVRQMSTEYGVPFWTFMQVGGEWSGSNSWRYPTEGEMLWQVSTALAFGAKGYTYYSYNHPPEQVNTAEGYEGLVGRGGQRNEAWYQAQKANMQTRACDHILMKSVYKGMIRVLSGENDSTNLLDLPEIETKELNGKFREVESITGDNSITGCFNYQGKTMLYVVNNSVSRDKAKVTLNLNNTYKVKVIQNAKEFELTGNKINLTFAPGEGACVVID